MRRCLNEVKDLLVIPHVVSGGYRGNAGCEQCVGDFKGDAFPTRCIFAVSDDEIIVVAVCFEEVNDGFPPRIPDDVSDKKYLHVFVLYCCQASDPGGGTSLSRYPAPHAPLWQAKIAFSTYLR